MYYIETFIDHHLKINTAYFITRHPEKFAAKPTLYNPPHHLLQFFIDCERQVIMNGQHMDIRSGDIMLSCANVPYLSVRPSKPVHAMNIAFETLPLYETLVYSGQLYRNNSAIYIPFIYHPKNQLPIKYLFEEIIHMGMSTDKIMKTKAQCLLKQLLIDIAIDIRNKYNTVNLPINHAIDIIERNPDKSFTIDELAEKVGMSRRTFFRNFKARTGKTVIQYQREHKIKIACSIFRTNPYVKIKEVSESLGFCDEYYFSNVFKTIMNTSPSSYKKGYL